MNELWELPPVVFEVNLKPKRNPNNKRFLKKKNVGEWVDGWVENKSSLLIYASNRFECVLRACPIFVVVEISSYQNSEQFEKIFNIVFLLLLTKAFRTSLILY